MMKKVVVSVLLLAFNYTYTSLFALQNGDYQLYQNDLRKGFVPNKGQFSYADGSYAEEVLAKTSIGTTDVYITKKGLAYVFRKLEEEEGYGTTLKSKGIKHKEEWCAMEMEVLDANISAGNLVYELPVETMYFNYYSGRNPQGVNHVKRFGQITIKEIYPGIDWVLYANEDGFKYDFVVQPGADVTKIKLKYKGEGSISLDEEKSSLKMATPLGALREGKLVSFTEASDVPVSSYYKITGDIVSFDIKNYDKAKKLVIDPPVYLVWSTIINPSTSLVGPMDIFSDQIGNSYITGYGGGGTGFPLVDPGGSTYYSGSGGLLGGFIMKLNNAGGIVWCTYFENLDIYGTADLNNNVYITGALATGFPANQPLPVTPRAGAYNQSLSGGGNKEAFVGMFDAGGVLQWATYLGGNGDDHGLGIRTDATGNLYVIGVTESTDFPTENPGGTAYFNNILGGSSDAFITKFDVAGAMVWSTYVGGTSAEVGRAVCLSSTGHVNITGYTSSATDFPFKDAGTGNYFQGVSNGNGDAFVTQFDNNGTLIWSTYFGGAGADVGMDIETDGSDNIYVCGGTASTDFPLQPSPGLGSYNQASIGGSNDIFLSKFSPAGVLNWSTYYGGSATDILGASVSSQSTRSSIVVDGPGNIYVVGTTESVNLPMVNPSNGAFHVSSRQGASEDIYLAHFDAAQKLHWSTYFGGTAMDFSRGITLDTAGCIIITGETTGIVNYPFANPGGDAYCDSTHASGEKGMIAKFCNEICRAPVVASSGGNTICGGESLLLSASRAAYYTWHPSTGLSSSIGASVTANPTVSTTYSVIGFVTGGCSDTNSIVVTVNPAPVITSSVPPSICIGASTTISASGGTSYSWSPATGLSSTTGSSVTANPSVTTLYTFTVTANGCSKTSQLTVSVEPLPTVNAGANDTIDMGSSLTLSAAGGVGNSYSWSPSVGLSCVNCSAPVASPSVTTTYYVTVTDANGCTNTDSLTIYLRIPCDEALVVPNVITPNADGINDLFKITGFDPCVIDEYTLKIYNRWGIIVFETNNATVNFWNGKSASGNPVTDGTYYYILSSPDSQLKGFVTVINK